MKRTILAFRRRDTLYYLHPLAFVWYQIVDPDYPPVRGGHARKRWVELPDCYYLSLFNVIIEPDPKVLFNSSFHELLQIVRAARSERQTARGRECNDGMSAGSETAKVDVARGAQRLVR